MYEDNHRIYNNYVAAASSGIVIDAGSKTLTSDRNFHDADAGMQLINVTSWANTATLGSGIGDVAWKDIEILGDEQNAPVLKLYGMAEQKAREKGLSTWSVSISHSQSHCIALVVAIG